MIARDSELLSVWWIVRRRPAWLSEMSESLDLSAGQEAELWEQDDCYRAEMRALEGFWLRDVAGRVMGLRDEMSGQDRRWVKERRAEYLASRLKVLDDERRGLANAIREEIAQRRIAERLLLLSFLKDAEKASASALGQLRGLSRRADTRRSLSPDQIERAKDRPLDDLLPEAPLKGHIFCPLHQERTGRPDAHASMWVKRGFGHCFSCGGTLDAIGYMMKVRGLSFREAVEALQ